MKDKNSMQMNRATVIGAGLAGCEAAWQLLIRGIAVDLYEMKPHKYTPAHHEPGFAELVCSNSLRSDLLTNAVGLLKEEMRMLDSLIMKAAEHAKVPAGGALAVDRQSFSGFITEKLMAHPLLTIHHEEVEEIPDAPCIIATGPLTSESLARKIAELSGDSQPYFFDAAAPIVMADSLDMSKIFRMSRYGRGDDYLNCPMTEQEYNAFYEALITAEVAPLHDFEADHVFEGCLAVEIIASRGRQTLAYGPLKPVGLIDPATGKEPYAVVQLRQDNSEGTMYNLVGFQTRLKFGEQKRVFGMIPGLQNAEYARYGVMHRNTFLNSPKLLGNNYEFKTVPGLFFAGQMTGVEGYVESAGSGLVAGITLARQLKGQRNVNFTERTALGAMASYVIASNHNFQPMNANFGIIEPLGKKIKVKKDKYNQISMRALETLGAIIDEYSLREDIDNA